MALGSTEPLTEIGSRGVSWGVKVAGARAENFASCLEILGTLASWSPKSLSRPV